MNRKLLALAVAASVSLPVAALAAPATKAAKPTSASSAPASPLTLYGLLNVSLDMADVESQGVDQWELNSNSSRIGVKGEEALSSNLSAIYMVEWGTSADSDDDTFSARSRYLGFRGGWGTLKAGRMDSPLKTSQGAVDVFNDQKYADMGNYVVGENRLNNLIQYDSPMIADMLTISVAVQPGEAAPSDDGLADGISTSVVFQRAGLYAAVGVDIDVPDTFTGERF